MLEWVLAAPAAVLLLSRPMRPALMAFTVFLLLEVYVGAVAWVTAFEAVKAGGRAVYLVTPGAFALVAWCAALPWIEERLARPSAGPAPVPARLVRARGPEGRAC